VKVSYAFDDKNKSNCLARWPHLITTRVVELDKDTVVGAVEFKTCILSMISARSGSLHLCGIEMADLWLVPNS